MKFSIGQTVEVKINNLWSSQLGVLFLYHRKLSKSLHRVKYKGSSVYENFQNVRIYEETKKEGKT